MLVSLGDISAHHESHSRTTDWWKSTDERIRRELNENFVSQEAISVNFNGLNIELPKISFGSVSTSELLGLDELIIFSFYFSNTAGYRIVADLGANIGVHSLVLSLMGFQVIAFEPDPQHGLISRTLLEQGNADSKIEWVERAVVADSKSSPVVEFVRVKGNTTSSHVKGAKSNPYGVLETIKVSTESLSEIVPRVDLVKMDVEGLEAELLASLSSADYLDTDFMVEVGSRDNAKSIFELNAKNGIRMFSQKTNWGLVSDLSDMPHSYKEGSLFISNKRNMPW